MCRNCMLTLLTQSLFPKRIPLSIHFGILDEQIIHHTEGTIVENIIQGYLAISVICKLGRDLRQFAHLYQGVDIQQYDKNTHSQSKCTML